MFHLLAQKNKMYQHNECIWLPPSELATGCFIFRSFFIIKTLVLNGFHRLYLRMLLRLIILFKLVQKTSIYLSRSYLSPFMTYRSSFDACNHHRKYCCTFGNFIVTFSVQCCHLHVNFSDRVIDRCLHVDTRSLL